MTRLYGKLMDYRSRLEKSRPEGGLSDIEVFFVHVGLILET